MDKLNLGRHISRQFNQELEAVRNRVLTMGGMAEKHIGDAITALAEGDTALAQTVIDGDERVNALEKEIDNECNLIIARRQPAASDLRLIIATIKTITDLERIGDEAEKIGRLTLRLADSQHPHGTYREIEHLGRHVQTMVRDALDGFARLAAATAVNLAKEDEKVNAEFNAIMRQNITYMMEDPRSIRRLLDVSWAARSLERVGDHAKNIGEYIVYLVEGRDLRHASIAEMERYIDSGQDSAS